MDSNEELIKRMRMGDSEAESLLISRNTALIYKIMSEYYYLCEDNMVKEDMVQAGNFGLLKAARKFDLSYGTRFSTFAYKYIKGEILRIVESELSRDITFTEAFICETGEYSVSLEDTVNYFSSTYGTQPEHNSQEEALSRLLSESVLDKVSQRQKEILKMRYMEDLTQKEIGGLLGIHQVEVSREEKRARKLLLNIFEGQKLCGN